MDINVAVIAALSVASAIASFWIVSNAQRSADVRAAREDLEAALSYPDTEESKRRVDAVLAVRCDMIPERVRANALLVIAKRHGGSRDPKGGEGDIVAGPMGLGVTR